MHFSGEEGMPVFRFVNVAVRQVLALGLIGVLMTASFAQEPAQKPAQPAAPDQVTQAHRYRYPRRPNRKATLIKTIRIRTMPRARNSSPSSGLSGTFARLRSPISLIRHLSTGSFATARCICRWTMRSASRSKTTSTLLFSAITSSPPIRTSCVPPQDLPPSV